MPTQNRDGYNEDGVLIDDIEHMFYEQDEQRGYSTVKILRENKVEQTELIKDRSGKLYIRKFINKSMMSPSHVYERLQDMSCPFIPRVVSVDDFWGKLRVINEFVEGVDLSTYIKRNGPLTERQVAPILICVCEALKALHGADGGPIIHKDVNPSNIIVHPDGQTASLVDFGIARAYKEGQSADTQLYGTRGYAAPEQFGFKQTDPHTDIYSLGQVMRFMLTGLSPEVKHVQLSKKASEIFACATAWDPSRRYDSVEEFAMDITTFLTGNTPGAATYIKADQARRAQEAAAAAEEDARKEAGFGISRMGRLTGKPFESAQSNTARFAFNAICIIAGLSIFAMCVYMAVETFGGHTEYPSGRGFAYLIMGFFLFLVPMALTTNFLWVDDFIPFLKKDRMPRSLILSVISFIVGLVLLGVLIAAGVDVG